MEANNNDVGQTADEIVHENFKGLDELINDKDLTLRYKSLIVTCIEEYAFCQTQPLLERIKELEKMADDYSYINDLLQEEIERLKEQLEYNSKLALDKSAQAIGYSVEIERLKEELQSTRIFLSNYGLKANNLAQATEMCIVELRALCGGFTILIQILLKRLIKL